MKNLDEGIAWRGQSARWRENSANTSKRANSKNITSLIAIFSKWSVFNPKVIYKHG